MLSKTWLKTKSIQILSQLLIFAVFLIFILTLANGCSDNEENSVELTSDHQNSESSESDLTGTNTTPVPKNTPVNNKKYFELAVKWSPVIYQDTDGIDYDADYIVGVDFDGDLDSSNNWENLDKPLADLTAKIYYSVIETKSHFFITYLFFHPRDWDKNCHYKFDFLHLSKKSPCHENDFEGITVVLKKSMDNTLSFLLMYAEAHGNLHTYTTKELRNKLREGSTKHLENTNLTFFEKTHPEVYSESKGHGVCALYYTSENFCEHPVKPEKDFTFPFPENNPEKYPELKADGVVYFYSTNGEEPENGNDRKVGYSLESIYDSIWSLRKDKEFFGSFMEYKSHSIGRALRGNNWGKNKANPPWAWDDSDDGPVLMGDFFLKPAFALKSHFIFLDPSSQFISEIYIFNPFLKDLEK